MEKCTEWLRLLDELGIWNAGMFIMVFAGFLYGIIYLRWARRHIKHLNFFMRPVRDQSNYPSKLYVEIRNFTGRSVVVSYAYFRYNRLRPDEKARGDTLTGWYEVKFPDRAGQPLLSEVEHFLRHGEQVQTWVPVDPAHDDQEIHEAIRRRRVGTLTCFVTWIEEKPKSVRLKRRM